MVFRAVLIVAAVAVGLLWIQTQRLERAQATARAQAAELDGYREAARITAAYAARREELDRQNSDLARELSNIEGRNAPLSDHLRRAAGRLWQ